MAANVPIGKAGFAGTMEAAGIEPANDSDRHPLVTSGDASLEDFRAHFGLSLAAGDA